MKKLFSVVICTRNRAASLKRTLQSLAKSAGHCAQDNFEILIVDNGGDLDGQALIAEFAALMPIRVVRELRPGLSIARNTGASHALGEWIVWTDDDVSVDPHWLSRYQQAITRFSDASVMGGPINPQFEGQPPDWLLAGQWHIRTAFAARGAEEVKAVFQADDAIPWGANFATLKAAVVRFPFDAGLGRHPNRPTGGGEESAVIRQILKAGGTGRWLPDAPVLHHIDPARQTAGYLRAYYSALGFRNTLATRPVPGRGRALRYCGLALYRAVGNELRCLTARLRPARDGLALHLKNAARNRGAARAWLQLALRGTPRH